MLKQALLRKAALEKQCQQVVHDSVKAGLGTDGVENGHALALALLGGP